MGLPDQGNANLLVEYGSRSRSTRRFDRCSMGAAWAHDHDARPLCHHVLTLRRWGVSSIGENVLTEHVDNHERDMDVDITSLVQTCQFACTRDALNHGVLVQVGRASNRRVALVRLEEGKESLAEFAGAIIGACEATERGRDESSKFCNVLNHQP